MRISGGQTEDGIVFGNTFDKYGSANPVVRRIMCGFAGRLQGYVERAAPASIHEVGCGEGYWTLRWAQRGVPCRGTDFSESVIDYARANAPGCGPRPRDVRGSQRLRVVKAGGSGGSGRVLRSAGASAGPARRAGATGGGGGPPPDPERAAGAAVAGAERSARGVPARSGEHPGHVQHWSRRAFVRFVSAVSTCFDIVDQCAPTPWTMLLCRRRAPRR